VPKHWIASLDAAVPIAEFPENLAILLASSLSDVIYHEDRKFKRGGVNVIVLAFDQGLLVA
jgi:hypothetical protein